MKTNPTSPKVTIPLLAGAITTLLVWVLAAAGVVDVPGEASAAITTVIMAVIGYFKRDPLREDYVLDHDPNARA